MTINNRRMAIVFAVLAAFLPMPLVLSMSEIFVLLDAVAVAIAVGVLIAYIRGGLDWFSDTRTTAGHLLVLGIVATWFALGGRIAWLWTWRLMGRPDHMFDHWFVALSVYLAIVGGALHLLANRAIDNKIPPSGWATLIVVVLVGLALGIGLVAFGYGGG